MKHTAGLLVLLVLAPPVHGLTLLDVSSGDGEGRQLRIRVDEPPLKAGADRGVELAEADVGQNLSRLDQALRDWRGFANTTTLNATGPGWLLLADGASGLALSIPSGDEGADAETDGDEDAETQADGAGQRGPDAGPNGGDAPAGRRGGPTTSSPDEPANASRGTDNELAEDRERARHDAGGGPPQETSAVEGDGSETTDSIVPIEPTAVGLGLLAAGAFAVERWQRRPG